MCVVSMVGDHYIDKWSVPGGPLVNPLGPTREEFNALKHEVEELKALLTRAKDYDARNGEPDCELDEKMAMLRKVACMVGIDLDEALRSSK